MDLIIDRRKNWCAHVSNDAVVEFERAIQSSNLVGTIPILGWDFARRLVWRALRTVLKGATPSLRLTDDCFAILMGHGAISKCLPRFLCARRRYLYCFDAWPAWHDYFELIGRTLGIDGMFFSSLGATEAFRRRKVRFPVAWIPEGIHVPEYRYLPYNRKDIDVLQFGRKYQWYHETIAGPLQQAGRFYLHDKGELVFPTRDKFIEGMARTKVSICIPPNITNPSRAGSISTMTVRYLQSMASKCLIVGMMPDEMRKLFSYTPIVEIDMARPVDQLLEVLDRYDEYIPLIERNYQELITNHSWSTRWHEINSILGNWELSRQGKPTEEHAPFWVPAH